MEGSYIRQRLRPRSLAGAIAGGFMLTASVVLPLQRRLRQAQGRGKASGAGGFDRP